MKIIDLTHPLINGGPVYPGDLPTRIEPYKSFAADGYTAYKLETGLHAATHIDMPMHLLNDNRTADSFDPELFMGRGVLIDVCGAVEIIMRPEYERVVDEGDIVLINTGFAARYGEAEYYTDYPAVSAKLAEFLVRRKVKMLGIDAPSPDYAPFPVHKILLGSGVFILENLANLNALHGLEAFSIIAAPIKIAAEAALTRAFALTAPVY